MNVFRFFGDGSHLVAIIILLLKIWKTRSCAGISGKSQILFALVFTTRYLDLFFVFVSVYNSAMKIFFLVSSYTTVYLIYVIFKMSKRSHNIGVPVLQKLIPTEFPQQQKQWGEGRLITTTTKTIPNGTAAVAVQGTYDYNHDTFPVEFLLITCFILSLLIHHEYSPVELLWTFSIYLEAVAILPQLFMVSKTGEAETITSHYLFALCSYRAFYILNWMYRYYAEGFFDGIAVAAGIVQTVLYADFFYLYATKVLKGKEFKLPA